MSRKWVVGGVILSVLAEPYAGAAEPDAFQFFEEEAKVVTASRRPQSISESPVAVEVITAADIKASGAVNLWSLLRFRSGMTVLDGRSKNGNRGIVSVRGFPDEFVRSLQVLVDGRSVYQLSSGGVNWESLPVQLQDIERIEIVRGPNAALYGSNAGLGVIQIITKKPEGNSSAAFSAMAGNLDTHISAEAVEGAVKNFEYRLSHTYRENMGFPLASTGDTANDFLHENKLNFHGVWALSERNVLEVLTGGVWNSVGVPPITGDRVDLRGDFESVKWSHTQQNDSVIEATAARDYDLADSEITQYDTEALYRLGWLDQRLYTTTGLSYRTTTANSPTLFQGKGSLLNEIVRAYVNQSARMTNKLSLVGAVSVEDSTSGDVQPAYQAAALYHVTPEHGFRTSYSRASTLPSFVNQHANFRVSPTFLVLGNPEFVPQKVTSYEVGYRGSFQQWGAETSLYYMTIRDFENRVVTPFPLPVRVTFDNNAGAIARGAETSVTYRFKPDQSVFMNYTYEHISSTRRLATIDHGTPSHMVNFGGRTPLAGGFSLSANIGYKDSYILPSNSRGTTVAAPAHTRVDARLGYVPPHYPALELFMSCQNMTQSDHVEFADGLTVPSTYQGGLSVKWGGRS